MERKFWELSAAFSVILVPSLMSPQTRSCSTGDLITVYKCLRVEKILATNGLLHLAGTVRTRTNGWELKPDILKLEIRHRFYTVRLINYWNKLPREVMHFPSHEASSPGWLSFWKVLYSNTKYWAQSWGTEWHSLTCVIWEWQHIY